MWPSGLQTQTSDPGVCPGCSAGRGGDRSVGPVPVLMLVPGALVIAVVPGLGELDPGGLQGVDLPLGVGGAVGGRPGEPVGLGDVLPECVDDSGGLRLPAALAPDECKGCPGVHLPPAGRSGGG